MEQLRIDESDVIDLAMRTNLDFRTVRQLMSTGWVYREKEGEAGIWVSPSAGLPIHIEHHEPRCDNSCLNQAPHVHGLRCHRNCPECHGVCHPECPAYKEQ